MRKFCLGLILNFICCAMALAADDITVKATVSQNRVALGSGLTYTITVTGAQNLPPPQITSVDGFDVRYTGPSTRVSVINGAYSVEEAFNYALIPLKEGKFTVPSFTIDVKGQTYTTDPIFVEVTSAPIPAPGSDPNALKQDLESRLKLAVTMPKDHVYTGEALPLTVRLYVNQLSLQELSFPEMTQDGFYFDPFAEPRQMNEVVEGINWHVVEFVTNIYPSRSGELIIPSIVVRGNLVFKMNEQRDPSGNIFEDGFFSNFFSSYQKRPITITSRPIRLQVLPLPEEGRPADFSGAVGQYDLSMEASPLKVKAGDPITLRVAINGAGNLKAVKLPEFRAEGFKVYDPQIKDEPGRKLMEQVIIPTDVKLTQVPPVQFTYFDARSNGYKTLVRGPLPLEVSPPASGEEFQAVGFSQGAVIPETLGRDILFIKESPGQFERKKSSLSRHLVFYIVLAIYLQVWAGLLAFYFYRRKLLHDPDFARQKGAARQALAALHKAREPLDKGDARMFYDVVVMALNDYFIQRIGLIPGRTDALAVAETLRQKKIEERAVVLVADILKSAEQARFAGLPVDGVLMRNHLADAEDVIRSVERRVR